MLRSVLMTVSLSTLPYALLKSTLIMYVKPLVISLLSLLSAPSCELCVFRQHWAWWSLSHMLSESLVAASFERSLSRVSSRTMGRTPPLGLGIVMSLALHSWGWASCGLFRRRSHIVTTVFLTTELSFQVFLRISALSPDIPTPLPPSRLMTAAMTSIWPSLSGVQVSMMSMLSGGRGLVALGKRRMMSSMAGGACFGPSLVSISKAFAYAPALKSLCAVASFDSSTLVPRGMLVSLRLAARLNHASSCLWGPLSSSASSSLLSHIAVICLGAHPFRS